MSLLVDLDQMADFVGLAQIFFCRDRGLIVIKPFGGKPIMQVHEMLGEHAMIDPQTASMLRLVVPSLETVEEDHVIQRILCNDLETVADNLPELPSVVEMRRLCDRIMRVTATHFVRSEEIFEGLPSEQRPGAATLAMLHSMHQLDELHGHDLVIALWQHLGRKNDSHIGQLAYMLRCFFDGVRRAIALKESLMQFGQRPVAMTG